MRLTNSIEGSVLCLGECRSKEVGAINGALHRTLLGYYKLLFAKCCEVVVVDVKESARDKSILGITLLSKCCEGVEILAATWCAT
jgi:hypothetical protein